MEKSYGTGRLIRFIAEEVQAGRASTVGQLWRSIQAQMPEVPFDLFRRVLNQMRASGYVETSEPALNSFRDYLKSWRFGFRLWLSVGATIAAVIIVEFLQVGFPLSVINWVFGTFLVLFAPGYALTWALFPSKQSLSSLSRFVLTVAMSLFLVPSIGILLNFSPIGIRPGPIALILGFFTLGLLLLGAYREFEIST